MMSCDDFAAMHDSDSSSSDSSSDSDFDFDDESSKQSDYGGGVIFDYSPPEIAVYEKLVAAYLNATSNTINVRHDWEWLENRFRLHWKSIDEFLFRVLCKNKKIRSFLAVGEWTEDDAGELDSRFSDGCRTLKIFSSLLAENRGFLQHLSIRSMCFRDYCFETFSLSLQHNNTLLGLDLSGNSLTDYQVQLLARSLASNNTLKSLDLQYNSFGDAGCRACIELLRENKTLTTLDLKASDLSIDVIRELYELFHSGGNISLHLLSIGDMPGLRDFRLEQLCEHVAQTNFYLEKLTSVETLSFLIHTIVPHVFSGKGKNVPNELKAVILADAYLDHIHMLASPGPILPLPESLLPEAKTLLYKRWVDVLHLGLSFAAHR